MSRLRVNKDLDKLEKGSMIFLGPTMCGKSVLLKWLIREKFRKMYDFIFVYSPMFDKRDYDYIPEQYKFTDKKKFYDFIQKCFEENRKLDNEGNYVPSILFILDDISGAIERNNKDMILFETITSRGRHLNIYCVFLIQHITMVSTKVRCNSRYIFVNSLPGTQIKHIYELIGFGGNSPDKIKELISEVCQDHHFLCFNVFATKLEMQCIKAEDIDKKFILSFETESSYLTEQ